MRKTLLILSLLLFLFMPALSEVGSGAPSVTNPAASPGTIAANGIGESTLNVSVVDDIEIDVVVIDLTQVGGPARKIMSKVGDSLYSTSTNASSGTPPGTYHLQVNATDLLGNYNNTVSITLNVSEFTRGDVNRNGRRDTGDATLILRNIVGLPIPSQYLPVLPTGDMNCNSRIDTGDATLVLRDVVGLSIPRCWE